MKYLFFIGLFIVISQSVLTMFNAQNVNPDLMYQTALERRGVLCNE